MNRNTIFSKPIVSLLAALLPLLALTLTSTQSMALAPQADGGGKSVDIHKVTPDVFRGDVRKLRPVPSKPKREFELREPPAVKQGLGGPLAPAAPSLALAPMPSTAQNFAGMSRDGSCTGGLCGAGMPPDTNGDVGRSYYVQSVNSSFAIYNKTGTRLAAFTEDSLWSGSTNATCNGNSEGDPVVVYDALADRWILTNFAFAVVNGNPVRPFYECIAVSRTSDPVSGGWYLYAIRTDTGVAGQPPVNTLNDYPKFGIWTDCLYYSANGFLMPGGNFNGGEFGAFSRSDMYAGRALTGSLGFRPSSDDFFTMVPSNLSAPGSAGTPPAGTPNYFVQESTTQFSFLVRKFTVGTNCSSGTLGAATSVSQSNYAVPVDDIVPQPSPATSSNMLDSIGERLLQKVQYRKVGSAESLWVTHTFRSSSSGPTGLQWAQINVTGGSVSTTPVQQQLFDPGDGLYRWMGSIAADKSGNAALGYSTSNGTSPNFPSIAYSGRLATDPLNALPQTQKQLVAGSGSQIDNCGGSPCHRWGDYSSMSVDPVDGCTFWFTSQYYASQTAGNNGAWDTRIGSFKFPTCGTATAIFRSGAAQDGWVLESGQGTGVGGSMSSTAPTLRLGDDAINRQYRSILSFTTSSLPDTAVITAVTLKIQKAGLAGSSPFTTLGNIAVDLSTAGFNGNMALELGDFQVAASQSDAFTIANTPASGWYSASLGSSFYSLINKTGTTQFRLRFGTNTNNNAVADFLKFYSGDYTITPGYRPKLVIVYHMP